MVEFESTVEIKQAMDNLSSAFRNNPDYAWSWHCVIAMAAFDEGLPRPAANRAAARVMKSAFNIDMTQHWYYPDTQKVE